MLQKRKYRTLLLHDWMSRRQLSHRLLQRCRCILFTHFTWALAILDMRHPGNYSVPGSKTTWQESTCLGQGKRQQHGFHSPQRWDRNLWVLQFRGNHFTCWLWFHPQQGLTVVRAPTGQRCPCCSRFVKYPEQELTPEPSVIYARGWEGICCQIHPGSFLLREHNPC